MAGDRAKIHGSERATPPGARVVGPPDKDRIEVTVVLEDGADPGEVAAFARDADLEVLSTSPRLVRLAGPPGALGGAFGVRLELVESPELGRFRRYTGGLSVPSGLSGTVHAVLGLDDRPVAQPHLQVARQAQASFSPKEIAALYGFPTGVNGAGQTVGIIELGGGFDPADLAVYWREQGISPAPGVTSVGVDGAGNSPDGPNGADGEVALDIEVIGSVAPGAAISVYFAPNTDAGFLDAIDRAAGECTVISISWGQAEDEWAAASRSSFDLVFQDAAKADVTVTAAAGDRGSGDGVGDGQSHVDFPASSPNILGCGGTRIAASGGRLTSEVVWNEDADTSATGGGVSRFFALPGYQDGAGVPDPADTGRPGRGVPDVSGDADPATGYEVRVDGQELVFGGTSAVAPLWAGLIALVNQQRGSAVGFANPRLYAAGVLRDVSSGDNGAYRAAAGWDACTGLGSPDGAKVLAALRDR